MHTHTSHKIQQLASPPALEMELCGAEEFLWNDRGAIPSKPYSTEHHTASVWALGEKEAAQNTAQGVTHGSTEWAPQQLRTPEKAFL